MTTQRWQYKAIVLKRNVFAHPDKNSTLFQDQLNKIGAQGWELVTVTHDGARSRAFFKKVL